MPDLRLLTRCLGYTRALSQFREQPLRDICAPVSLGPRDGRRHGHVPDTSLVGTDPQRISGPQHDLSPVRTERCHRLRHGVVERLRIRDLDAGVLIDVDDVDLHAVRVAGANV